MTLNNIAADLERECNNFFTAWRRAYSERNYADCSRLCSACITDLKPRYLAREIVGATDHDYTCAYLFLILAKGLADMAEVTVLTKDTAWPQDPKKTELIWDKLWDAKERLGKFSSHWQGTAILDDYLSLLDGLEGYFYDAFGKGYYFSPEIIILKSICSVCGQNIKACDHIPGNIYDGVPCQEKVMEMDFKGISIVASPHDMRCRLWPWNMKEDNTVTGRFMSLNTADSFLRDGG